MECISAGNQSITNVNQKFTYLLKSCRFHETCLKKSHSINAGRKGQLNGVVPRIKPCPPSKAKMVPYKAYPGQWPPTTIKDLQTAAFHLRWRFLIYTESNYSGTKRHTIRIQSIKTHYEMLRPTVLKKCRGFVPDSANRVVRMKF